MSKIKVEKPKVASPGHSEPVRPKIEEVKTVDMEVGLIQTNGNVRKHFDPKSIEELAGSIAKVGVLQPVIVRQSPGVANIFQLIAGERRLRAVQKLGLLTIPARIVDVDDQTAAVIQASENLHRKDLTPIEEAQAFKMLMDQGGYSAEDVAQRIDKSVAYVYRAVRLLELPEPVVQAIDQGKLTQAHGHQLLRIPSPKKQLELAKACIQQGEHARDLKEKIESELGRDLDRAQFPKDQPYGGAQACAGCRFNSGEQGDLFDGVEKGRCTNASCFDSKVEHFAKELANAHQEKNPKVKFLGVNENYYQIKAPAGMQHVESTPGIRSLVAKKPEQFAFAVCETWEGSKRLWKINYWAKRTPEISKAQGYGSYSSSSGSGEPRTEYTSRIEAVQELVDAAVRKEFWEKAPDFPTSKVLLDVIDTDEMVKICQVLQIKIEELKAFPPNQMMKALWFLRASALTNWGGYGHSPEHEWSDREKATKIDRKRIEKQVKDEAEKVWPKLAVPVCKVCGCSPRKACTIDKKAYITCWWVKPGICSACQNKPLPAAKPEASAKKAKTGGVRK